MKFNEKLIALRKKEGLSQEELGYKLNVTRQTVSKWELGQTTPEMDKLSEMSKIFNISVDQLINDSEIKEDINMDQINNKIEDQPIQEKTERNNKIIYILVGILIIIMVYALIKIVIGFAIFNKAKDEVGGLVDQAMNMATDIYYNAKNEIEEDSDQMDSANIFNNFTSNFNQLTGIIGGNINSDLNEEFNQAANKVAVGQFNGNIELFAGTSNPSFVVQMLDNIITSNKTNDRKISVKYDKTETQVETEIRSIKQTINKMKMMQQLEVICEYDAQGYIYKVIIEKV